MATATKRTITPSVKVAKKAHSSKLTPVSAEGAQCFWVRDGEVLATMHDLERALHRMDKDTYAHHVTKERNDFADWVECVLIDTKCAQGLRIAKGQKAARVCVLAHLAFYG